MGGVGAIMGRDIGFEADNRFDISFFGGIIKINCAIHDAVVGDGDTVHTQLGGTFDDAVDSGVAVEEAVFGMDVEMHKIVHGSTVIINTEAYFCMISIA